MELPHPNLNRSAQILDPSRLELELEIGREEQQIDVKKRKEIDTLKKLVKQGGGRVNGAPGKVPPLLYAITWENLEGIKYLLRNGADIDGSRDFITPKEFGYTTLHYVVQQLSSSDAIRYFVEQWIRTKSIDVLSESGLTSLHYACAFGKGSAVEVLIDCGANVNAVSTDRLTPLYFTTRNGDTRILECLLGHGADIDLGNFTPLAGAVLLRHLDAVKYLISKGASMTITVKGELEEPNSDSDNDNGLNTLLQKAIALSTDLIEASPLPVVKYLIEEHGADPRSKDRFGYNLITYAAENKHWDVVAYLNCVDPSYLSLYQAAGSGDLDTVRSILGNVQLNIDIDSMQELGITPLQLAANYGHTEVVRLLIAAGADVTAKNSHATVLHFACYTENEENLRLILESLKTKFGDDEEGKCQFLTHLNIGEPGDSEGDTPLYWAIENENLLLVKILLEVGSDPTVPNMKGESALDWVKKLKTSKDVVDKLQSMLMLTTEPNKNNSRPYCTIT